jgi:protein-tyrosine-phosphatase
MEHYRILSVCRSNVVRSEMFRQMMETQAEERGIDIVVESAGIEVPNSPHMPKEARAAMSALRYEPRDHTPRQISTDLANQFDTILFFSDRHLSSLNRLVLKPDIHVEPVHEFAGTSKKVVDPRNMFGSNWILKHLTLFDLDIKLRQVNYKNKGSVERLYLHIARQIDLLAAASLDRIAMQRLLLSLLL